MVPELMFRKAYTKKISIWSKSVTAIEMAEAAPPFMEKTHSRAQYILTTGEEKNKWKMLFEGGEKLAAFLEAGMNHDEPI